MEEKIKILAKNNFTLFLDSKKKRKTPERFTILEKIFSLNKHFDIDTLHTMLEDDSFHVSKATIYNTINLLIESGLVKKHSFDKQQAKYGKVVGNTTNQYFLICTECGKVKEVKDLEFSAYMNARKYNSFTTKYFQLNVYGMCNNCVRKIKRKNK